MQVRIKGLDTMQGFTKQWGRWGVVVWLLWCLATTASAGDDLQRIVKSQQLRVGIVPYAPWTLKDAQDRWQGFEVDVAKRLAKDMGVGLALYPMSYEQLIPALLEGEIDVIAAGFSMTPERALQVNFTRPYAESGVSMVVNKRMTKGMDSLQQLNNSKVKIAAVGDSLAAQAARRLFRQAQLVFYKQPDEAVQALLKGKAHVLVESIPTPKFLALQHPEELAAPMAFPLLGSREGFAVRQGNPNWMAFLNAWIEARQADNWLSSSHQYWFETLRWQPPKEGL